MTRNPACAICGCDTRPLRFSEWNGRTVTACKPCLAAPSAPDQDTSIAQRVYAVVSRCPGSDAGEICEAMGIADSGADEEQDRIRIVVYQWLSKLARRGSLRTEGGRTARLYYAVDDSLVPKRKALPVANSKPRVAKRSEEKRAEVRAYRAGLRDRRMAAGLCVKCGKARNGETGQDCRECKDQHRDNNWIYRNTPRGRKKSIRSARKYYKANKRKIRANRREKYWALKISGTCRCGNPAEEGTHCETCTETAREASRSAMSRLRAERLAEGLCCRCGKRPPVSGGTACRPCRKMVQKWKARRGGK